MYLEFSTYLGLMTLVGSVLAYLGLGHLLGKLAIKTWAKDCWQEGGDKENFCACSSFTWPWLHIGIATRNPRKRTKDKLMLLLAACPLAAIGSLPLVHLFTRGPR